MLSSSDSKAKKTQGILALRNLVRDKNHSQGTSLSLYDVAVGAHTTLHLNL